MLHCFIQLPYISHVPHKFPLTGELFQFADWGANLSFKSGYFSVGNACRDSLRFPLRLGVAHTQGTLLNILSRGATIAQMRINISQAMLRNGQNEK